MVPTLAVSLAVVSLLLLGAARGADDGRAWMILRDGGPSRGTDLGILFFFGMRSYVD